ncbi:hypothetical protein HD554DRAFT_2042133 [Boletus coccyginus]|nr:hypothetical protein HD554DRAFT_2042133 [Boletus coccyginus]
MARLQALGRAKLGPNARSLTLPTPPAIVPAHHPCAVPPPHPPESPVALSYEHGSTQTIVSACARCHLSGAPPSLTALSYKLANMCTHADVVSACARALARSLIQPTAKSYERPNMCTHADDMTSACMRRVGEDEGERMGAVQAPAQAKPGRSLNVGPGLDFLRPKPLEAGSKPSALGQAGPCTTLVVDMSTAASTIHGLPKVHSSGSTFAIFQTP